jgi:hypothetical protein
LTHSLRFTCASHERNVTHVTRPSQAQMFNDLLKKDALAAAYRGC